jgi:hypothetical protein
MMVEDPALAGWIAAGRHWLHWALPAAGVILVIAVAKWLDRGRRARDTAAAPVRDAPPRAAHDAARKAAHEPDSSH